MTSTVCDEIVPETPIGNAADMPRAATRLGPVTRRHIRRTVTLYALAVAAGAAPLAAGWDPAWQAAGQGLWMPGGGFIAVGGWALLLFPATLLAMAVAVFLWFGAGMVIAPPLVWLAAAAGAGALAGDTVWSGAPALNAALVLAFAIHAHRKRQERVAKGQTMHAMRLGYLPKAIAAAHAQAAPAPEPGTRELTAEQLASLRYCLDRALQPINQWNGYDRLDEYQTAARRYQINGLSYTLALSQSGYTPSFHGYLSEAQRMLIDRYLQPEVWRYWVYERAWGHLRLTDFDPAGRDNIMLTGFFAQMVGLYQSATGDRRYAEPGSLTFRLNERTSYPHSLQSIARSVSANFNASPYCLFPCEPNWVYPGCNHYGMVALVLCDRLFGTDHAASVLDRWLHAVDDEFTDPAGSIIGLRSSLTGFEFAFSAGEGAYAQLTNSFHPGRAWRMWATARTELNYVLKPGPDGLNRIALPGPGFDFGNYRGGHGMALAGIACVAREFGDEAVADAAFRSLDETAGRSLEGGVLRYTGMSNWANANAVQARLRFLNAWRETITQGPPAPVFRGPILAEARYPDVLVAKAFSRGEDLALVLHPGATPGPQTLGIERLRPERRYRITGLPGGETELAAGRDGRATLTVPLHGRTELTLQPIA